VAEAVGYYPGCSLKGTSLEYHLSLSRMIDALGLSVQELEDWNCCGATAAHAINDKLALALPFRNLAIAQEMGFSEVLTPCAACFSRFAATNKKLAQSEALKQEMAEITQRKYRGTVKVINLLEFIQKYALERIKDNIKQSLKGLRLACYYGCLLLRPPKMVCFDDPENPKSMEEIIESLGAETTDWPFRIECCGGGFSMSRTDVVLKLSSNILENAKALGADALVTACPMCHSNLDMRQRQIEASSGRKIGLPIFFITELVGISLGMQPKEVGLRRHFIPALEVLSKG